MIGLKKNEADSQRHKSVAEENRRLKDSFATLCSTNLHLKKQLKEQDKQCSTLKKRVSKLQTRLSSLHAMVGGAHSTASFTNPDQKQHEAKRSTEGSQGQKTKGTQTFQIMEHMSENRESQPKLDSGMLEQLLSELLDWLARDSVLKSNLVLNEKFCQVFLPLLAAILPKIHTDKHAVILHFVCSILQRMSSELRMKFSASLRRVGDTCARRKQVFSGSPDIKVRIFSCLLILQTLSQADLICSSLERLKQDLSAAEDQSLFLSIGGVKVLLPYFQSAPRYQVMSLLVMDIFVLVSTDSGAGLVHFLNKDWFSAAAGILAGVNSELSEKLIILLQRLSTTRTSGDLFDKCGITAILQSSSYRRSSSFVQLNVTSIMRNLSS